MKEAILPFTEQEYVKINSRCQNTIHISKNCFPLQKAKVNVAFIFSSMATKKMSKFETENIM